MTTDTQKDTIHDRDGDIVLYKRDESSQWQARYRIRRATGIKWFRISTKTEDIETAKRVARTALDKHRFTQGDSSGVPFSTPSKLYQAELEALKGTTSEKPAHNAYLSWIKNWIDPFFIKEKRDIPIAEIDDDVIDDWYHWCIHRTDKPRDKKPGEEMTAGTMASINTAFRNIWKVAKRKKWVQAGDIPELHSSGRKTVRRPYFSKEQYAQLASYMMNVWIKKPTESASILNARLLLRDYVLFMANTGLRPGKEVDTLRWCDITDHTDGAGHHYVIVNVRTGKTGAREVVARPNVRPILKRIRDRNQPQKETDFIFRLPDGYKIKELRAMFSKLLKQCGLKYDFDGKARTLYSLRHTYASFRILYGNVDRSKLAQNMGTSTAMIERHYSHLTPRMNARELAGSLYKDARHVERQRNAA